LPKDNALANVDISSTDDWVCHFRALPFESLRTLRPPPGRSVCLARRQESG
jgi:hypothetical protein